MTNPTISGCNAAASDLTTTRGQCGEALSDTLTESLARVPFYCGWRARDPGPGVAIQQRYDALPILTKRDLRANMPRGFVPQDRDFKAALEDGEIELVTTSGTSEDRVSIVWYQPWWDGSERAAAALHTGLERVITGTQREAVLTTPLCAGTVCHIGDLSPAERTLGNLLFLNQKPDPNYWTPHEMDRMLDEVNRFQPEHLEADPAYLAVLARHAADTGVTAHQPRFISLTYEFPSRLHRRQIGRVWGAVPTLSSYGSTETGHVFTACEHGQLHQNTAFCHVDFQPLRAAHGGPAVGRILVTLLGNPWVYLLRFDVGDLVRLADTPCPCGRTDGSTVAAIEGRVRDVTFTAGGRAVTVGQLDAALGDVPGLLGYQVEQQDATHYLCRCVAEPGTAEAAARAATVQLEQLYGPGATVTVRRETAIVPEQSGKFRLARTRFPWDAATLF